MKTLDLPPHTPQHLIFHIQTLILIHTPRDENVLQGTKGDLLLKKPEWIQMRILKQLGIGPETGDLKTSNATEIGVRSVHVIIVNETEDVTVTQIDRG